MCVGGGGGTSVLPPFIDSQLCPWLHVLVGIMSLATCYVSNYQTGLRA